MADPHGFLTTRERELPQRRPVDVRIKDWKEVYEEQQSHVDEDDIVPNYVRLSTEDNTTVSNNNSTIWNYALPQISTWIQDGGLTDETWNQYIETLKSSGIEENIELWQKWYDEYMAKAA